MLVGVRKWQVARGKWNVNGATYNIKLQTSAYEQRSDLLNDTMMFAADDAAREIWDTYLRNASANAIRLYGGMYTSPVHKSMYLDPNAGGINQYWKNLPPYLQRTPLDRQ